MVGDRYYWIVRIHPDDALARGIAQHDLVRVFNDRGTVICAADVSPLIGSGTLKASEASGVFDPISTSGDLVDRGGCMNILVPERPQAVGTTSISPNSCLVEIAKWQLKSEVAA